MKASNFIISTALAVVLMAGSTFAITNGRYYIMNKNSQKFFNVWLNSSANGAQIVNYHFVQEAANMMFDIESMGGDHWKIRAVNCGKVLQCSNFNQVTAVTLWDDAGSANQSWRLVAKEDGYYQVQIWGAQNMCMDDLYGNTADGSAIGLSYSNTYGPNQGFMFIPVKPVNDGIYSIRPSCCNYNCFDVWGASTACGASVKSGTWLNGNNQKWNVTRDGAAYRIAAVHSGMVLQASGVNFLEGVTQWWDAGYANQRWYILSSTPGNWQLANKANPHYMINLYGANCNSGADLLLYTWVFDNIHSVFQFTAEAAAPSYSGYTLWSSENFDNGWDGSKWTTGCGTFGENATRFDPAAVYTSGGQLHLKIWKQDNWGNPGCENAGQLRGYFGGEFRMINPAVTYGICEARINTPGNGGYIASIFTYDYGAATNRTDGWNEIDVELEGRTTDKVSTNLLEGNCSHSWECTQWCYCACSQLTNPWGGFSHAGQWHDYRIEFTPSFIKWFVDGNCIRTIDGSYVYRNPNGEDVRYSSATNGCSNGWRDGYIPGHSTRVMTNMWLAQHGSVANALGGEWSDSQLPKECLYDWIRVYTRN
jgi:hypothetical protein